jgi:glucose/arabinose dehydrogenase
MAFGGIQSTRLLVILSAFFQFATYGAPRLELLVGGLAKPVFLTAPPEDTSRLFILEQHTGNIRIYDAASGKLKTNVFLKVTGISTGNEQGLLGLAFHPGYQTNGFFFVNITAANGRTEILRFTAQGDPATSATADSASRKLILTYPQPESNHNGGWLGFGLDGYLYISSGDGGGGNDMHGATGNGQSRTTLLGKILRIDVDAADPYGIPDGNPYKGDSNSKQELWAFGLRNPWRCSFDSQTGDLWIGDVGQGQLEEIDVIPAGLGGLNFGWRPREGTNQTPGISINEKPVTPAIEPVATYGRTFGASVTGGYLYRGSANPELSGKYIYADYVSGRFWLLTPEGTNGTAVEITSTINPAPRKVLNPSSFGQDNQGELYVCEHGKGQIYRIAGDAPAGPKLSASAVSTNEFVLRFQGVPGRTYTIETKTPLVSTNQWTVLTNLTSTSTDGVIVVTNALTASEQYFRLRIP